MSMMETRLLSDIDRYYPNLKIKLDTFTNPLKFVNSFKQDQYDLVILDQSMPELKGHVVVENLGKIKGGPMFAMMTGFPLKEELFNAFKNTRVLGIFPKESMLLENLNRLIFLVATQKRISRWNRRLRLMITLLGILFFAFTVICVLIILWL